MGSFEETRAEVRYHLSQLSARNAHHSFEDLARALARSTVSRNLLPATGPVSAGGDQGLDFETFESRLPVNTPPGSNALGLKLSSRVGFAATLNKSVATKVRSDVKTIAAGSRGVDLVVIYVEADVPVAKRHALQEELRDSHGVDVEIFDGAAISELLAVPSNFWIAQEYLHLAARVLPPSPDYPDWYVEALQWWRDDPRLVRTPGHLADVRSCIRYATAHPEARADLPFWLSRLERLLKQSDLPLGRQMIMQARYEYAIAQLRGLGDLRPADSLVLSFVDEAMACGRASMLSDAATLLMYAAGAQARALTDLSRDQILGARVQLLDRAQATLRDSSFSGERCELLCTIVILDLMPDLEAPGQAALLDDSATATMTFDEMSEAIANGTLTKTSTPALDISGAIDALAELVKQLPRAPLFPVEAVNKFVALLAGDLVDDQRFDQIARALDARVAEVTGGAAQGDAMLERAFGLFRAGRNLAGLSTLHDAAIALFSGEASRQLNNCLSLMATVYAFLGFRFASKQFALISAAILQRDDLDLLDQALFKVAVADFHEGAWISCVDVNVLALSAHGRLVERPFDFEEHPHLSHAVFELEIIKGFASTLGTQISTFVSDKIETSGAEAMLEEIRSGLVDPPWWELLTPEEFKEQIVDELGNLPFADAHEERLLQWRALGVHWRVQVENVPAQTVVAERFAAALQITLASIARLDPTFPIVDVAIQFSVLDTDELEFREIAPSHPEEIAFEVGLSAGWARDADGFRGLGSSTLGAVWQVISALSVRSDADLRTLLDAAFESGLSSKIVLGLPYDFAHADFLDRSSRPVSEPLALTSYPKAVAARDDLETPTSPGPGYSPDEGAASVRFRYERLPSLMSVTLAELRKEPSFLRLVEEMRGEGWLDWHLLIATHNVAKNARYQPTMSMTQQEIQAIQKAFSQPEPNDSEPIPPDQFTKESLTGALAGAVTSTGVNHWKLTFRTSALPAKGIRALLDNRFGFSTDDVPHDDPFIPTHE